LLRAPCVASNVKAEMTMDDIANKAWRIKQRNGIMHVEFLRCVVDAETVNDLFTFISEFGADSSCDGVVFRFGRGQFGAGPAGRYSRSIAALGPGPGLTVFTRLEKTFAALERWIRPSVLVLDGPIGMVGLEFALVADLTIATPNTIFYLQGPERGFLPGMSSYRLVRHIGLGHAKEFLLHRSIIPARQAQRLGIVHRVSRTPHRVLRAELPRLRALPPMTLSLARQMLHEATPISYHQAYDSYKAAQFHCLHESAQSDLGEKQMKALLHSAAEYAMEPLGPWIEDGREPHAKPWSILAASTSESWDADAASILLRLDRAGVAGAVLYPNSLLGAYSRLSGPPLSALLRRYNDWILELCAGASDRLRAAVLLDVDDPEVACAEVRRTAPMGAAAAVLPLFPHNSRRYDSVRYEPLWEVIEQWKLPITLHRGACRQIGDDPQPFDLALHRVRENDSLFDTVFDALEGGYARLAIAAMILSGVFARYPDLRVVTVGFGLAWAPYALLRLDEQYEVRPERAGPGRQVEDCGELLAPQALAVEAEGFQFPEGERPSDHFRRHVFVAVDDDPVGLELSDVFGARNILWAGQQRPGGISKPGSTVVRRLGGQLTTEERAWVESRNAAALYRLLLTDPQS
jgi:enoyl-CoA hydratase/carnithine racemase/predicted TIM-barrel fold metal-dependent hydrolase